MAREREARLDVGSCSEKTLPRQAVIILNDDDILFSSPKLPQDKLQAQSQSDQMASMSGSESTGTDETNIKLPPPWSDSNKNVEEYPSSSDHDYEDDTEVDPFETQSVISVSSAISEHEISDRPWRHFNAATRECWERMYGQPARHAMSGSWDTTESYQRERDAEMLRYLEDFPLKDWVLPPIQAGLAYASLQERMHWRALGIPIYRRDLPPAWIPGHLSQTQNVTTAPARQQPPGLQTKPSRSRPSHVTQS